MKRQSRVVIGILLLAVIGANPAAAAESGFVGFMSKLGDAALLRPIGLGYTAISTALYAVPTAPVLAAVDAVSGKNTLTSATHHMVKRPFTFVFLDEVGEHRVAASIGDVLFIRSTGLAFTVVNGSFFLFPVAPLIAVADFSRLGEAADGFVGNPFRTTFQDPLGGPQDS